jgi:hypothetical protein
MPSCGGGRGGSLLSRGCFLLGRGGCFAAAACDRAAGCQRPRPRRAAPHLHRRLRGGPAHVWVVGQAHVVVQAEQLDGAQQRGRLRLGPAGRRRLPALQPRLQVGSRHLGLRRGGAGRRARVGSRRARVWARRRRRGSSSAPPPRTRSRWWGGGCAAGGAAPARRWRPPATAPSPAAAPPSAGRGSRCGGGAVPRQRPRLRARGPALGRWSWRVLLSSLCDSLVEERVLAQLDENAESS